MSHQTAAVPPDMHIESARSTSSNVPAQPRSDKRTRNTRCTAELPPTSRPGPERSARRSLGAPCIPPSSADSNINALCLGISAPSHRSSQLAQPGVDPKRLAVARWSLVVVRVVQILVCAICAWTTAASAVDLGKLSTRSQAAHLLQTLLLVFCALCCFAGTVDLWWLLLVLKPEYRRPVKLCCGGKPYSCELTCDITNIGIWLALLLSILVQKLWFQWKGIASTSGIAALHGLSAGLVVWMRLQAGPAAAAAGDGGAAAAAANPAAAATSQPSATRDKSQQLIPQPAQSGRGPRPSTGASATRSSQYRVRGHPRVTT